MRVINSHKVNPVNDLLRVHVIDEPGQGGANHVYHIIPPANESGEVLTTTLAFQNGPINEVGINGITHEVLLAVVIDRLQSFQAGPFACRENALALTKLEEAQHWLHHRTKARMDRGVEGTNQT